jgi:S-adenosylhomocysteine hydrolase
MFPVGSPWAVNKAFDEFANRCETTLVHIFKKSGSEGVDYKAWLYQVAEELDQKVAMLHLEPLNVTADYLGVETSDEVERAYLDHSAANHWNENKVA